MLLKEETDLESQDSSWDGCPFPCWEDWQILLMKLPIANQKLSTGSWARDLYPPDPIHQGQVCVHPCWVPGELNQTWEIRLETRSQRNLDLTSQFLPDHEIQRVNMGLNLENASFSQLWLSMVARRQRSGEGRRSIRYLVNPAFQGVWTSVLVQTSPQLTAVTRIYCTAVA